MLILIYCSYHIIQYLRDSERPATLIALWKSKGETDSTRRFYLYFSESIASGLPRPDPFVPPNEPAANNADDSHDDEGSHSPRGALDTLKRGLNKLAGGSGSSRKNKSGTMQTDEPAKSPPTSPRVASPTPQHRAMSPTPTTTTPAASTSAAASNTNSVAASILTSSAGSPISQQPTVSRPNRSLTEAAALKTKVESPYRTIPSDLWADADVADTSTAAASVSTASTAAAASPTVTRAAPQQSEDVKFLEQLLSQPSAGGVQDMRLLSSRDDDDDDDGFRMSLIDRPNEEFLKEVKLGKTRSEHKPVPKQPVASAAAAATAAKPRASAAGEVDPLAELEQVWLEQQAEAESRAVAEEIRASAHVRSQRERVADSAIAAIDDMLVGLDDDAGATVSVGTTSTEPILMAIPAPAEHVEEEESPYNQIPKGLGRPSFQKPAGQDPAVFQAKVAAISRASSTRAPVEVEPAPEDVDELMRELAADENVQRAMLSTQELKALDEINVSESTKDDKQPGETANAAAAADEWDFEADLQKAQDELATHLAELNGI